MSSDTPSCQANMQSTIASIPAGKLQCQRKCCCTGSRSGSFGISCQSGFEPGSKCTLSVLAGTSRIEHKVDRVRFCVLNADWRWQCTSSEYASLYKAFASSPPHCTCWLKQTCLTLACQSSIIHCIQNAKLSMQGVIL